MTSNTFYYNMNDRDIVELREVWKELIWIKN